METMSEMMQYTIENAITDLSIIVGVAVGGWFALQLVRWGLAWARYIGDRGPLHDDPDGFDVGEGMSAGSSYTPAQVAAIKAKSGDGDTADVLGDGGGGLGIVVDAEEQYEEWELAGMGKWEYQTAVETWSDERWAAHWAMIERQKADGTFNYGRRRPDDDDIPF